MSIAHVIQLVALSGTALGLFGFIIIDGINHGDWK